MSNDYERLSDFYARREERRRIGSLLDRSSLTPGKRYRLTVEGTARPDGGIALDNGMTMSPTTVVRYDFERLPDPAPEWAPGDVVIVCYGGEGKPYTYVRGTRDWPGDVVRLSDDEVTERWYRGEVEPVLQSGGVAFDVERLS